MLKEKKKKKNLKDETKTIGILPSGIAVAQRGCRSYLSTTVLQ